MAIELEGLEDVLGALNRIADTEKLDNSLGKACALVERTAKQNAPKDTGELRRSITSKVENHTGIVFTPLEYAPYRYVRSLNRAKSGKPKQLKYHTI